MRSRALALFLAFVMAWMGSSAQEQVAQRCTEAVMAQLSERTAGSVPTDGSLDDHHLDTLPFSLLADLVGLLRPEDALAGTELRARPVLRAPSGWLAPDLDGLHRPPIARA